MGKKRYTGPIGMHQKPRWMMSPDERAATRRGKIKDEKLAPENGGFAAPVDAKEEVRAERETTS